MALNDDDISSTPTGSGPEGTADGGAAPGNHDGGTVGAARQEAGKRAARPR
ncbi:hypothetical protein ABT369_55150 [Dactylosporangium sp. NPDC000244]|uniref:hypothetical protein n=1 Tax=Dactylosporangium sp. NPDC000244 TaxID=3154365 RepID=UPI0033290098